MAKTGGAAEVESTASVVVEVVGIDAGVGFDGDVRDEHYTYHLANLVHHCHRHFHFHACR